MKLSTEIKDAVQGPIVRKLDDTIADVISAATFEEALHALALEARLMIGAHQCAISYVPAGDFTAALHTHSFSTKYAEYRTYDVMPTGEGIWGVVVENKASLRMTDEELTSHPRWKHFGDLKDERGLEHPPMRGWLVVPVLDKNRELQGVLQLSDKFNGEFSQADEDQLEHLATLIAPTFELQYVNCQLALSVGALSESQQSFHSIVEQNVDGLMIIDADGALEYVNPSAGRMFGRDPADMVGRTFGNPLIQGESCEVGIIRSNGERGLGELRCEETTWHGQHTRLLMLRDITAHQEAEDRAQAILDATLDCIVTVDGSGTIIDINPAAQITFGYTKQEAVGKLLHKTLFPTNLQKRAKRNLDDYLSKGEAGSMIGQRLDLSARRKDGSEFSVEMAIQPITMKGETALAVFLRDITVRKRMEQELERRVAERTEELREANERLGNEMVERERHQHELAYVARRNTMGEMASGLAHELNQPLTAIVGYAENCLERVQTNVGNQVQLATLLEKTVTQATRASEIIQHLRDLVAKRKPERLPVNINQTIRDVVEMVAAEEKSNKFRVRGNLANGLPHVMADRIQIEQVLLNLILNAFEAMTNAPQDGREMSISTQRIAPDQVEVRVSDHGCGVSDEELQRMFEAHFSTKPDGLGMGLPISRTIVETHGGRLRVERNHDTGLTFRFALPIDGRARMKQ